jgi:dienelactone hydrolase
MASFHKSLGASAAVLSLLMAAAAQAQTDCNPPPADVARLVEIRPGFHRVAGPLAEFDPCHRSVQLSMPGFFADKLGEKPPLMIIAHGGGGPGGAEQEMVRRMNARGVATLLYDAYELNGFRYRGTLLFVTGATNESRQRMIFKATLGAYHWARQHPRVDTSRLFIHGLSNGGSVALNMAAVVDPAHVRAVFSEGAPAAGIGMPDQIRVPLKMIFGKLDNYGGKTEDDWMHLRTDPCMLSQPAQDAAPGTTQRCSLRANPTAQSLSPQQWGDQLKAEGQPLEFWFYDDAAHGIFAGAGAIDRGMRTYGSGPTALRRYGWIGASPDAANRFTADLMKVIKATYP